MNRKLKWGAVALAACAVLTACGGGTPGKPVAEPTVSPRERFLAAVQDIESWQESRPSDDEIAGFPPGWCEQLGLGHTVEWLLSGGGNEEHYPIGWDWGTKVEDARIVVVAAVSAYCPERKEEVLTELKASGYY